MKVNLLGLVSMIADIMPFFLIICFSKLLKQRIFIIVLIFSLVSFSTDIIFDLLNDEGKQQITFYFIVFELIFVGILFFAIVKYKANKVLIITLLCLFILFSIIHLYTNQITGYSKVAASFGNIIVLLLCIVAFVDLVKKNKNEFLIYDPGIWFIVAYFLYAANNLFLFATTDKIPNLFEDYGLWAIFIISNLIKNIFICIGIWQGKEVLKVNNNSAENKILDDI